VAAEINPSPAVEKPKVSWNSASRGKIRPTPQLMTAAPRSTGTTGAAASPAVGAGGVSSGAAVEVTCHIIAPRRGDSGRLIG
jgi:hypothetical protein